MALTKEIIKANADLAPLTDDQISSLVTLSTNDENTVIGTRIGELHGQYEKDVLGVTGIQKNQGEKAYDYVKRILTDLKTGVAELPTVKQQIETIKSEKLQLEADIKAGKGNEVITKQLQDAKDKIAQLSTLKEKEVTELKGQLEQAQAASQRLQLNNEFAKGLQGVKYKAEIPESVRQTYIDAAMQRILATTKPDFIDDGKGGKALVFRNAEGVVLNNPQNALNPFTAGELLKKELTDIIDATQQKGGGGAGGAGGGGAAIDLAGATTQMQADELIGKYLATTGVARGSKEFAAEQLRLRKEHSVEKLPIR
ncbi:MAG: hypothetical protein ACOYMF_05985 [Bacteroidales bacterium]